MEYILWGVPENANDWEEVIITKTSDENHLNKAKEWAIKNNFKNLRVMMYNTGDKPDFHKTIRL